MDFAPTAPATPTSWWTVPAATFGDAARTFDHKAKVTGDAALPLSVRHYLDTLAECQHRQSSALPPSPSLTIRDAIR